MVAGVLLALAISYLMAASKEQNVKFKNFSENFADANVELIIYGTSTCPACKAARNFLTQKNIAFLDLDIESSLQARKKFATFGVNSVPLILFRDRMVIGFDPKALADGIQKPAHVKQGNLYYER